MNVQGGKLQPRQAGARLGQGMQQGDRIAAAGKGDADAPPAGKAGSEELRNPPGKISGRAVP